jgi:hypothetical protein
MGVLVVCSQSVIAFPLLSFQFELSGISGQLPRIKLL